MRTIKRKARVPEERAGAAGAEAGDDTVALRRLEAAQELDAPGGVHAGLVLQPHIANSRLLATHEREIRVQFSRWFAVPGNQAVIAQVRL
jgi:hypothetical protein